MPRPAFTVPVAHSGPISDVILERAIAAAASAERNELTEEGGALLLLVAGPAMHELLLRRRAARMVEDLADVSNVLHLPSTR